MKITSVRASTHNVPVKVPLLDKPIDRPLVFVQVETDDGVTGYGLTGGVQRTAVKEFVNQELAPFLKGRNPLETEAIMGETIRVHNPRTQTGVFSSSMSAVDIALWDIKGKHYGEPVWRLLGGAKKKVPAYVTFGLLEYDKEQLVEVARSFVREGQDKLKMVSRSTALRTRGGSLPSERRSVLASSS